MKRVKSFECTEVCEFVLQALGLLQRFSREVT